ncbi:helix-turn-helix domain-containing protein [Collinsella intestinalis]|uniref:helix-turn-helix domain-containing protein n=1 Tax=Collinsella intestinalis TaxID=147207 RepID=UPI0022E7CB7E|nr:helix-turn-helix transcriptional regulator [Collinsella intestinalis]
MPACLAHVEWGREIKIVFKVGSRIHALREAAGLTQSELAAAAYVTRQSVGNWEHGNTLPDVQSLQLVAKALNTTVDGLLGDGLPAMIEETVEARRQLTRCLAALGVIFALELILAFLYPSFFVRLEVESSAWCSAG